MEKYNSVHPQKNLSKNFKKREKGLTLSARCAMLTAFRAFGGAFKSAVPIADYETTFFKGDFHYEVCM